MEGKEKEKNSMMNKKLLDLLDAEVNI